MTTQEFVFDEPPLALLRMAFAGLWMMSQEYWQHGALEIIVAAALIVAGYHRFQAARGGERISRQGEGVYLFLAIRLCGLTMLIAMLGHILAPTWFMWAKLPIGISIRWFGVPISLLSIILLAWTMHTLGKNLTDTVAIRKSHTLVTSGPYRWIRHPFYIAMLGLIVGTGLLSANWLLLLAGAFTFLFLAIRVQIEERFLLQRFGEPYADYQMKTGRFLPKLVASRNGHRSSEH